MAEKQHSPKRAAPADSPAPQPAAKSSPALQPAASSSDPAVHQVLAELDIARRNGDSDAVWLLTETLADLGYE